MPEIEEPFEIWWEVGMTVINTSSRYVVTAVHGEPDESGTDHISLTVSNMSGKDMGTHPLRLFKESMYA